MDKHTTGSPALSKNRRLSLSSIRVRRADPPVWPREPEIIEPDRQLQNLLSICGRCDSIRKLLDHTVPIRHVFACEGCGQPVALISVAGDIRRVDAISDSSSCPPFQSRGWTCNALGSDHVCEDAR